MTTALHLAAELYRRAGRSLEADIGAYLTHGYVFGTPDRQLWTRPIVVADGPARWLTAADAGQADAWHVGLAIGEHALRWFVEQMPWYLPRVTWYRRFRAPESGLHIHDTDRLIAKFRRK